MKFTFHIGTGKAGSSSIQMFLKDNTELLDVNKTCYLGLNLETRKDLNNRPHSWQVVNGWSLWIGSKDRISSYISAITEQAEKSAMEGYTHLVVSNESIFGTHDKFEEILAALKADGHIIQIIAVLRRPHEWIRSAYLQWGIVDKTYPGHVPSFSEWSNNKLPSFAPELKKWLNDSSVSKSNLINLDSCGNLLNAFASLVDICHDGISDIRVNETREPYDLYLRWLIANHTNTAQPPDIANRLLMLMHANGFQPAKGSSFSYLWDDHNNKDELNAQCDKEAKLLNELLLEFDQEPFPTSATRPPKGFDRISKTDILSCQEDVIGVLIFCIARLQSNISDLEQAIRAINKTS